MPPLAIAGGLAAAGSIGGALIGGSAATSAASTQAAAATTAAELQAQSAQQALNFQEQVYNQTQQTQAPILQGEEGALANLESLLGVPVQGNEFQPTTINPQTGQLAITGPMAAYQNPAFANPATALAQGKGNQIFDLPAGARQPVSGVRLGGPTAPAQANGRTVPLSSLVNPGLGAPGSLSQGWQGGPFVAPTAATEVNDPGYQFRLQQGMQALQNSAAAQGTLLTGGTAAGIQRYGQDYASNEYQNVYNRALGQYQQSYNQFQQQQANEYNRLAALAGTAQVSAQQLGQTGLQSAGQVGNTLLTSAGQIGQQLNNAGAATASGYVGAANAYGGAVQNLGGLAGQYALMSQYGGGGAPYQSPGNGYNIPSPSQGVISTADLASAG
jgi:hypothetical protein